jgi:hypothetical protein
VEGVRIMAAEITLIIQTHESDLLWNDFRMVINQTIRAMSDVGANLASRDRLAGTWHIEKLSMDSPTTVTLRHEIEEDEVQPLDWMKTYVSGIEQLEQGEERPPAFSESALKHVSRLRDVKGRVDSIKYITNGQQVISSLKTAAHASVVYKDIQRPDHYYSYGELRGRLGQITIYGAKTEFGIFDPLTRQLVHCHFSIEQEDRVKALLTKQVAVLGKIKYDRNDRPKEISVESFESLKDVDELASFDEIHEVMSPLPEGMSPEEYIEEQRDGE